MRRRGRTSVKFKEAEIAILDNLMDVLTKMHDSLPKGIPRDHARVKALQLWYDILFRKYEYNKNQLNKLKDPFDAS